MLNLSPFAPKSRPWFKILKWLIFRKKPYWPPLNYQTQKPKLNLKEDAQSLIITYINHSSCLIQTENLNILTDPVWSNRVGPFSWIGIKRVHPPAFALESLMKIDVILISHNHYDHLDLPTLKYLIIRDNPLIITGLNVSQIIPSKRVIELNWWQSHQLNQVIINYCPAKHHSGRGLFDGNKSLWGGFVIQCQQGPIYFAGDTGYAEHFKDIYQKFGPMRASLLPIGAYEPREIMSTMHVSPAEAVQAHLDLQSMWSMSIHFETFQLADDAYKSPQNELKKAMQKHSINEKTFVVPNLGQSFLF